MGGDFGFGNQAFGFSEALAQYATLLRTCLRLGYTLIDIPQTSVAERAQFILGHLPILNPAVPPAHR